MLVLYRRKDLNRLSMVHGFRNDQVLERIAKLNSHPSDASRTDLYTKLTEGSLLLAVANIPEASTTLNESTSIVALTTSMPDGGTAILAFTDFESLQKRLSNPFYIVLQARDVLEMVIDQGYDGLVLNPAGPWAAVPRRDIEGILDDNPPA
jgi:hypothetical protein